MAAVNDQKRRLTKSNIVSCINANRVVITFRRNYGELESVAEKKRVHAQSSCSESWNISIVGQSRYCSSRTNCFESQRLAKYNIVSFINAD